MKATVLAVGTELLFGSVVNTNAVYISRKLQMLGIDVMYHMTVGDNPKRLFEMLDHIYKDCDLVIVTGGLGPTQDDLTKETIAEYFGVKNVENKEQVEILKANFKAFGRPMTENNLKQAYFPVGAVILPNANGTAPGFILGKEGKYIISLPGPPKEMNPMFMESVYPWLLEKQNAYLYYKTIRTVEIGESNLETELFSLIDKQTDPTLATYAEEYEATLRIASKRKTKEEAEKAVENTLEKVKEILGYRLYSSDDENLTDFVVKALIEKGISIASAESMTGGAFAKAVTSVPNASKILSSSYVTYSEEEKCRLLGVSEKTIKKYGVVSSEVAMEMADGLSKKNGSDISISVTGFAGPLGDDVGLYYIGLKYKDRLIAVKKRSRKDRGREYIRGNAVRDMFVLIYKECLLDGAY